MKSCAKLFEVVRSCVKLGERNVTVDGQPKTSSLESLTLTSQEKLQILEKESFVGFCLSMKPSAFFLFYIGQTPIQSDFINGDGLILLVSVNAVFFMGLKRRGSFLFEKL
jgi:hypothetical protein